MTTQTLSPEKRLAQIDVELSTAERMAAAEKAYRAAFGIGGLWEGAIKHLERLKLEKTDIELQVEGRRIAAAEAQLRELDRELEEAQNRRNAADHALRLLLENQTVARYRQALSLAIKCGFGASWQHFQGWYETGRERFQGLPADGMYFLDNPTCPDALRFDLIDDRTTILKWRDAVGEADRALLTWGNAADRRSRLLREHPELTVAST
ncbi:MAG TPA: hypothetical protein VFE16_05470 [Candidatus Cybelea sp.]|jgi:hypothetical protein|nr:hypothetical protein [Candidatus Cybelea sp.]